jgi:hypothetical protein
MLVLFLRYQYNSLREKREFRVRFWLQLGAKRCIIIFVNPALAHAGDACAPIVPVHSTAEERQEGWLLFG